MTLAVRVEAITSLPFTKKKSIYIIIINIVRHILDYVVAIRGWLLIIMLNYGLYCIKAHQGHFSNFFLLTNNENNML